MKLKQRALKRYVNVIFLMTFTLQATIAQGLMPGKGTWLEVCTSQGLTSLLFVESSDASGTHLPEQENHTNCPFSSFFAEAVSSELPQPFIFAYFFSNSKNLVSPPIKAYWPAKLGQSPPFYIS